MKNCKHVLLIDDDEVINMINTRIIELSKQFGRVTALSSASDALNYLGTASKDSDAYPDFIFLDINMPEKDGWEFLSEFASMPNPAGHSCPPCRIFILSSSIDLFDIKKARSMSFVSDYIVKPLDLEKVNQLISRNYEPFSINQHAIDEIGL